MLHPKKIDMWFTITRFFNDNINAQNYQQVILEPLVNKFHNTELRYGIIQQNEAIKLLLF